MGGHAEAFCELERIFAAIDGGRLDTLEARLHEAAQPSPPEAVAVRIRQFISANSTQRLTLPAIARAIGCSVRTATSTFRAYYQLTICEYLVRLRLLHATKLLIETDLKLAAVA